MIAQAIGVGAKLDAWRKKAERYSSHCPDALVLSAILCLHRHHPARGRTIKPESDAPEIDSDLQRIQYLFCSGENRRAAAIQRHPGAFWRFVRTIDSRHIRQLAATGFLV